MSNAVLQEIGESISNLDGARVLSLINEAISQRIPASEITEKGLRVGLEKVGRKYEMGEYFLTELLYSSSIMSEAMALLRPYNKEIEKPLARMVLGTVRGDMHDLGKNIFKMLAISAGIDVVDLGVDVDPEKFVDEASKMNTGIVGISALLTTSLPGLEDVLEKLKGAGIRQNVRVIIGGNAVTKEFAGLIEADAAALNAVEGIEICKNWYAH